MTETEQFVCSEHSNKVPSCRACRDIPDFKDSKIQDSRFKDSKIFLTAENAEG